MLQALGIASLLSLPVIALPTMARVGIGLAVLIGYQVLLDTVALETVLGSNHGGLVGSLSWAALLILSTAVADLWRRGPRAHAITCGVLILAAALAMLMVPVSKNRVSLSYILLTLALSGIVLLIIDAISRAVPPREDLLCWWGRNALALYLVHLLLLGVLSIPGLEQWNRFAPLPGAFLLLVGVLGVLSAVAAALRRRQLHWRL